MSATVIPFVLRGQLPRDSEPVLAPGVVISGADLDPDDLRRIAGLALSPDQMAGVLNVVADIVGRARAADEERKRKQRERQDRHRGRSPCHVTKRDSHVTVTVTPPMEVPLGRGNLLPQPRPRPHPDGRSGRSAKAVASAGKRVAVSPDSPFFSILSEKWCTTDPDTDQPRRQRLTSCPTDRTGGWSFPVTSVDELRQKRAVA